MFDVPAQAFVTFSGILQINYVGMDKLPGGETVEELEVCRVCIANHVQQLPFQKLSRRKSD